MVVVAEEEEVVGRRRRRRLRLQHSTVMRSIRLAGENGKNICRSCALLGPDKRQQRKVLCRSKDMESDLAYDRAGVSSWCTRLLCSTTTFHRITHRPHDPCLGKSI